MLSREGEEVTELISKISQRSLTGPDGMLGARWSSESDVHTYAEPEPAKKKIFYVLWMLGFLFEFRNFADKGPVSAAVNLSSSNGHAGWAL